MEDKSNFTLALIKPHIVKEKKAGNVLSMIEKAGFTIVEMGLRHLSKKEAEAFYGEHASRPFFNDLCNIMSSGPLIFMILSSDSKDVVKEYRDFIGATNPKDAASGTVRAVYGNNLDENAVHGSDSVESAVRESLFFDGFGDSSCCSGPSDCCRDKDYDDYDKKENK